MHRSIEALANHQIRRWELARRSSVSVPPLPCVVISRLPGAGGVELGQNVASSLGYPFFDREIVEWVAQRTGQREHLVAGLDEHVRNAIDRFVTDGFARERFTESEYLHHLVRVLVTLGERGGAVILGRGAQFILPPERALRIFVVASREERSERIRRERSLSAAEAALRVRQEDANRREFLRHHFRREPDDPTSYDLCLNTGFISMEAATKLVVDAYHGRFPKVRRVGSHPNFSRLAS